MPALIIAVTLALVAAVLWVRGASAPPIELFADTASDEASSPRSPLPLPREEVPAPTAVGLPRLDHVEQRDAQDVLAEGRVDAPVVMVVFSDYQCPYCAQWSTETLPGIRERVERGEVRIEWRDLTVYGEASERAARASYAAAQQGAHASFHAALFDGGQHRSADELSDDALLAVARDLDLDVERFAADMSSDAAREIVERNRQLGEEIGVTATPSFVIGGTPLVGAQPASVFTQRIDEALAVSEADGED